jgi:hypothetical protein
MDCQEINREDFAEKYLHHRLDATQMDEFEIHLLGCPMCAKNLELLQLVQADLAERAHEIRGWTAPKPHSFRWQIVVLAGIVIVVATASLVIRWQKMQTASVTVPPPQSNPPVNPTTADVPRANAAKDQAKLENPQTAALEEKRVEVAKAGTAAPITNLPVNGRNYLNFKVPPSKSPRDSAPSIGAAPPSGTNVGGTGARPDGISVDAKDAPDNSLKAPEPQQVAAANSPPAPGASKAVAQLSTDQGLELFRVGAVEPPPFSFAGMAAHAKQPKGGKSTTYSGNASGADTGRVLFQQGMNAYIDARYHDASGYLTSALKYEPSAADVNFYLGVCRILDDHPQESVPALKIAIAAGNSPYLQSAHYYLGKAYVQGMNLEGAETEFREAAKLTGSLSTDAKALLARVVTLRGQIEKDKQ